MRARALSSLSIHVGISRAWGVEFLFTNRDSRLSARQPSSRAPKNRAGTMNAKRMPSFHEAEGVLEGVEPVVIEGLVIAFCVQGVFITLGR